MRACRGCLHPRRGATGPESFWPPVARTREKVEQPLVLSVFLGLGIGLSLGLFGGGGSILAFPVLVHVAHLPPAAAVGSSLAVVGATSLIATVSHARSGRVCARTALHFGAAGILTSYLGARLTHLVPDRALVLAFAALMLVVGGYMLFGRPPSAARDHARVPVRRTLALTAGASVGLVTGFLGVGGGFLVVPALIALMGLDLRTAVGTSLFVILINSAAGFFGHLGGEQLDFRVIGWLTAASVLGGLAGARLAGRFPVARLRQGFAALVVVVGIASALGAAHV
jgi:uncharacterized protein